MTWVVPSGTFATTEIDGREVTVAGTYEQMDKTFVDGETGKQVDLRQGPGAVLEAPIAGIMAAAVEVVAFVFIVGGAFQIITATGAIDAGMRRVVRRFKSKDILVIPIARLPVRPRRLHLRHGRGDPAVLRHIPAHHDRHGLRFAHGVHDRVHRREGRLHRLDGKPLQRAHRPGRHRHHGQPGAAGCAPSCSW